MTSIVEPEELTALGQYLVSEKETIVSDLTDLWRDMKTDFQRDELCDNEHNGMDVRLIVVDGSWELHTGDVQYETSHEGFWGSGELSYDLEEPELQEAMESLADDLISQVLDDEAEQDLDSYWQ